jgi:hypothetical protein
MLTALIVSLGITTVVLSVWVGLKFKSHSNEMREDAGQLTSAISWQLFGEATISLVTLAFALGAHYDVLINVSEFAQSSLRFLAFFATSATTIHLYIVVRKLNG